MTDLGNNTALVTGASSGIGLAICRCLLGLKCQVIGIARDFSKTDLENHPLFRPHVADLANLDASASMVKDLLREYNIDLFVHSAGFGLFGSIEQFSVRQIDDYLTANLASALTLAHFIVPAMRRRKAGRIVLIGSESALQAGRKGALYSAAKFGLRGFAQALREDCARDGIAVTLINPGMVRTPFFDRLDFRPGQRSDNAIEADEIARLVLHVMRTSPDLVIDEINLSPRNRSIDFNVG